MLVEVKSLKDQGRGERICGATLGSARKSLKLSVPSQLSSRRRGHESAKLNLKTPCTFQDEKYFTEKRRRLEEGKPKEIG